MSKKPLFGLLILGCFYATNLSSQEKPTGMASQENEFKRPVNINEAVHPVINIKDSIAYTDRNAIYLSASLSFYFLLNYEREVATFGNSKNSSVNLALGLGGSYAIDIVHDCGSCTAATLTLTSNFITGRNKNHFEADIGLFINSKQYYTGLNQSIAPVINLGYRFQHRSNKEEFGEKSPWVFRVGVGFPQIIYISLGCAF